MAKFNKDFSVRIIAIAISVVFVFNDSLYASSLGLKVCLRLPIGNFKRIGAHFQEREEFKIGGINSDKAIRNLTYINDKSIKEIERDARSKKFIGPKERLKKLLIRDNRFVRKHGFTHQGLAEPLFAAMKDLKWEEFELEYDGNVYDGYFIFNNKKYYVKVVPWGGKARSVFNDGRWASCDWRIVDSTNPKNRIFFSELLPYFIRDYGFYEGNEGINMYRLSPAKIISFFFAESESKEVNFIFEISKKLKNILKIFSKL